MLEQQATAATLPKWLPYWLHTDGAKYKRQAQRPNRMIAGMLAARGKFEQEHLAERLAHHFPHLLRAPHAVQVEATHVPRSEQSSRYFIRALEARPDAPLVHNSTLEYDEAILLRFFKVSKKIHLSNVMIALSQLSKNQTTMECSCQCQSLHYEQIGTHFQTHPITIIVTHIPQWLCQMGLSSLCL